MDRTARILSTPKIETLGPVRDAGITVCGPSSASMSTPTEYRSTRAFQEHGTTEAIYFAVYLYLSPGNPVCGGRFTRVVLLPGVFSAVSLLLACAALPVMHSFAPLLALTGALIQASNAVPTPTQDHAAELEERGLVSDLVGDLDNLAASATGTAAYTSALSLLTSATPTATPTAASQCISALSSVFEASPTPSNIYAAVAKMASAGLMADDPGTLLGFVQGAASGENSMTNNNPKNPTPAVYPNANPSDAPYDLTEAQLREVIYIPSTFQYGASGAPQPIILVPGTGKQT